MSLLALQDLFRRHRDKASGVWRLGQEAGRIIFFDMGDIVFAQSGAASDRLTAILVERGKLTQAQMDYALANLKPGLSIGKNLIDMGFITQRDLLETARLQVERIAWGSMATPEELPQFQAKELENTVVRLPMDTPAMLLSGLLALGDREGVLDLLGPLNQVVVLEGKRAYEITHPQDLTRILPLLDGSKTLLEISREASIEPFRVGAFCLFLREMGWARLHELPPLDRAALEQALTPEPEPLSPPLPEPESFQAPNPELMAAIEAAAKPTTNLDHMAEALDALPDPISAPTPATPLQGFPDAEEEPILPISESTSISLVPPPSITETQNRPRILPWLLLILIGLGAGFLFFRHRRSTPAAPTPTPHPEQSVKPEPVPPPPAPNPEDKTPETKPVEPAPRAEEPPSHAKADRLRTIREADWDKAITQGAAHRKALDGSRWTLRLMVACEGATVQNAPRLLEQKEPDLWIVPIGRRDGKSCYQVLLGDYPSHTAAAEAADKLPAVWQTSGNRPKALQLSELPDKQ